MSRQGRLNLNPEAQALDVRPLMRVVMVCLAKLKAREVVDIPIAVYSVKMPSIR
jgi:hypothetical protein